MSDWSSIIAVLAFVLSVVSLGWQMFRARWERPVLLVQGRLSPWYNIDTDEMGWQATIKVSNVGDRAVTVTDFGWWYGPGTHREDVERPELENLKLPHRVEAHDQVELSGVLRFGEAWRYAIPRYTVPDGARGWAVPAAVPFIEYVSRPPLFQLKEDPGFDRIYGADEIIPAPNHGI